METLFTSILRIHIAFGAISLALFWIPIFTKKGKKLHNTVGKVYVITMGVVVITALYMCLDMLLRQENMFGLGLGLLALLTFQPLVQGYYMAHYKKLESNIILLMKILGISILLLGFLNLYFGVTQNMFLLIVFAVIGLSAGSAITQGYFKLKEYNHIAMHLSGMLISGGAAYTAFLAFGANSFMPQWFTNSYWVILPWTLPTFASIIAARIWEKKYPVKKGKAFRQV